MFKYTVVLRDNSKVEVFADSSGTNKEGAVFYKKVEDRYGEVIVGIFPEYLYFIGEEITDEKTRV